VGKNRLQYQLVFFLFCLEQQQQQPDEEKSPPKVNVRGKNENILSFFYVQ